MADKKISALTAATTPLAGTEVLPIVQGGSTVKVSIGNVTAGRAVSALSGSFGTGTPAYSIGGTQIGVTNTSANAYLSIYGGVGSTNGGFIIGANNAENFANIIWVGASNYLQIATTPVSSKIQFNVEGIVVGDMTPTGFAPVAGKGIDFSANTHAAGMTSELLNWYEEGAWTPSVGGDATYTIQEGYYVRVGDLVYAQCQLLLNVLGTGSTTTISGLPFQAFSPSNSSRGTGSVWYCGNLATNVTSIAPGVTPAGQDITFGGFTAAGASMSVPLTVFQNGTRVDFSLVYRAN